MSDRKKVLEKFENPEMQKTIADNIETYRKGNLILTITDQNGNPIPNVTVKAVQKNHEFRFGINLFMLDELETKEKNDLYKQYFTDVFNMATLPFYWCDVEPEKGKNRYDKDAPKIYRRPTIDLCMEFCEQNGIEPREHGLAYEHFFPKWLKGADTETVKAEYERRCREISERYADRIPTIEVTNEMFWKESVTDFYRDPDYIEWCFKTARKYFPKNNLSINDGGNYAYHRNDPYYADIKNALEHGAPIDSVGTQFHMHFKAEQEYEQTRNYYDPEYLYRNMDKYATLTNKLQITEITIPAYTNAPEDEEIQAAIIEKLYTIWFSHPAMEQIIYWNMIDGYAYVDSNDPELIANSQGDMTLGENVYYGGLLRFDMTPKAAYYKIKELINTVWHTEEQLISDINGNIAFRGFYGDYELTITTPEKTITQTLTLSSKKENTLMLSI